MTDLIAAASRDLQSYESGVNAALIANTDVAARVADAQAAISAYAQAPEAVRMTMAPSVEAKAVDATIAASHERNRRGLWLALGIGLTAFAGYMVFGKKNTLAGLLGLKKRGKRRRRR